MGTLVESDIHFCYSNSLKVKIGEKKGVVLQFEFELKYQEYLVILPLVFMELIKLISLKKCKSDDI